MIAPRTPNPTLWNNDFVNSFMLHSDLQKQGLWCLGWWIREGLIVCIVKITFYFKKSEWWYRPIIQPPKIITAQQTGTLSMPLGCTLLETNGAIKPTGQIQLHEKGNITILYNYFEYTAKVFGVSEHIKHTVSGKLQKKTITCCL